MCVTVPNIIKISQTVAEIWQFNFFCQNGGSPPSWICWAPIGTIHDDHLVASIVLPNLVKIDAVVSTTWNFQYFASLAWKRLFRYISPICTEAPRGRICTKFVTAVGVADVITSNKFFGDRSRGVDSKIAISHWQSQSPLTQGWRYHAARDNPTHPERVATLPCEISMLKKSQCLRSV